MEDTTCEHFYIDLSDSAHCKKLFDSVIKKCYESNTWKVEVWAMAPKNTDQNHTPKRRGILSYLSFRRKKSHSQTIAHTRETKSMPVL